MELFLKHRDCLDHSLQLSACIKRVDIFYELYIFHPSQFKKYIIYDYGAELEITAGQIYKGFGLGNFCGEMF